MVLAHGSGLDEALFTLVPVIVFGGLLWLAKRRAERADEADEHDADTGAEESE